ncbi:RagB/SusD family nutrient uptake outer membrane protein [Dysgonomonas sp.]
MKTLIIKYVCLPAMVFFLGSCNALDVDPVNIISEEKGFENESAIMSQFVNFYSAILIEDFKITSSEYNDTNPWDRFENYTGYGTSRKNEDALDKQGERVNGNIGFSWWDYGVVRNINEFLVLIDEHSSNFSPEQVRAWKSEAKVIRAWYYYSMAKRFGGVPIITIPQEINPSDPESMMTARSSEKDTWDFIIKSVDEAISEGLRENAEAKGRINVSAALTLKAQAAIYAASIARYNTPIEGIGNYTDPNTGEQVCGIPAGEAEDYYKIAFDAAKEIIKSKKYSLARNLDANGSDNFAKLFIDLDKHDEVIFIKYYQEPSMTHHWDYYRLPAPYGVGSMMDNPTLDLIDMYDYLDGSPAKVTVGQGQWLPDAYNTCSEIFEGRDYRLGGTVYYPGGKFPTGTFDVRRGIIDNDKVHDGVGKVTINGKEYSIRGQFGMGQSIETQTGFLLRKYINEANTPRASYSNPGDQSWMAMRYAEILLIAAEAAGELGVDEENIGLISLNDIRDRAGLPAVTVLSVDNVRKEWICEYAFENVLLWCKRRWRTLNQSLTNGFTCSGLEPYWDVANDKWKFKKIVGSNYPRTSFLNRYYYNQISGDQIATNPKIYQNYGY